MGSLMPHLTIMVVLVQLIGALITPIIGYFFKKAYYYWSCLVVLVSLLISIILSVNVGISGPITYHVGAADGAFGITMCFDQLSAFSVIILFIGLMVLMFSKKYIEALITDDRGPVYYALCLLMLCGLTGLVIAQDLFNFYVYLEIASLAAYALMAIGKDRLAPMAAFKYVFIGEIGSICILFGIFLLYSMTGTLNMAQMAVYMSQITGFHRIMGFSLALFTIGFGIKAALFPMHVWLPDAHAFAPSSVSALLSGLVVKAGIIGFIRIIFLVYRFDGVFSIEGMTTILAWLGALAIFMSTLCAVFQDDLKMIFAYSTIANIGYIVLGLSLLSVEGLRGGLIHVVNHSLGKAALFLCAGAIVYKMDTRSLSRLTGAGKMMPVTAGCLILSAMSLLGVPPTGGFVSKWYIALGAVEAKRPGLLFMFLAGSILTAVYYFRIINTIFFKKPVQQAAGNELMGLSEDAGLSESMGMDESGGGGMIEESASQGAKAAEGSALELPLSMMIPIIILALSSLFVGLMSYVPLRYIEPLVRAMLPK